MFDGTTNLLTTTYMLQGDRLEILLAYRAVQKLRAFGQKLQTDKSDDPAEFTYKVEYEDGDVETMDLSELQKHLREHGDCALRTRVINGLSGAYAYLERRLTGECEAVHDCRHTLEITRLLQIFDPSYAAEHTAEIDDAWVQQLSVVVPLGREDDGELLRQMRKELPAYLSAIASFTRDHTAVDLFTSQVLNWWENHGTEILAWQAGARITSAFAPTSAPYERIFALLKKMFTDKQVSALADYVQGSLMLRDYKRLA
ncbi:hypothetical protein CYMTET_43001 [Cymbomonas tetramitiformis]|uniref:Uncharacterized protein n=1 Tax=Cymbomonas tetramitiformis TaxID=36881 RepID=A0AAE0C4B8_9CHLO|nr:hypothetical protein CYMTET_43001 [Cymbomonas tetramitiformis]|eukprot:gene9413-11150_t